MRKNHWFIFEIFFVLILLFLCPNSMADTKYVCDPIGRGIPVYHSCNYQSDIIDILKNGEEINVTDYSQETGIWSKVETKGGKTGYIKTAYTRDEIYKESNAQPNEYLSYYPVEPPYYTVLACPLIETEKIDIKFTPTDDGYVATSVKMNAIMTVLAETYNWYQVREEKTGIVGYVKKQEVVTANIDPEYIKKLQQSYD